MSKAFTRESDDEEELPVSRPRPALPPGTKNYLTPGGAAALRKDMEELSSARQRALATAADDAEKKATLQKIDRRMRELEESLRGAEIVPLPEKPWEQVRFGATVRVRDELAEETRYRIVGAGETNLELDWVSWISPIGRALLNQRVGGKVKIQAPGGSRVLDILEITYE